MPERDFLSSDDVTEKEQTGLLELAAQLKASPREFCDRLAGRQVALIFEKPSTRTRVSFEVAVTQLGGDAVVLRGDELQLGRGETIADTGAVLAGYVDAIAVRTFAQERLTELADAATVPVINMLSDLEHPCQALADLQTITEERGGLAGQVLAYFGDGNNVAHSLMLSGVKAGIHVRVATPRGYEPQPGIVRRCEEIASSTGGSARVTNSVEEAARGAGILYTDVWASMGQEDEAAARLQTFAGYQIDEKLVELAEEDVIVMHCLPAHRGQEIAAGVMDGVHSVVFVQAANRLHTQKALLAWLLAG